MGKFLKISRRIIAAVMIAVTLSCTVVGDVLQVQQAKEVYAAAEFTALHALIESIMAAMGLTFSSRADLNNAAAGLNEQMASSKSTVFTELSDLLKSYASTGSGKMYLSKKLYQILYVYLYNQASGKISSASDVKENFISDTLPSISSMNFKRMNLSNVTLDDFVGSWCASDYYLNVRSDWKLAIGTYYNNKINVYEPNLIVVNRYIYQEKNWLNITLSSGTDFYLDSYSKYGTYGSYVQYSPLQVLKCYKSNGDTAYSYSILFNYDEEKKSWVFNSGRIISDLGYFIPGPQYAYFKFLFSDSCGIDTTVYLDSSATIYNSYDDYKVTHGAPAYAPTKPVYGSTSAAKTYDEDETAGTVSVPISPDSITEKVEEAVTDAMTKNPSITEEQLNDAVTKVLDSNAEISGDITEGTATVAGLLTSILKAVQGVAKDVTKIKQNTSITDGSSALDLSDVTDAFTVIEGSAGDNKDDDDKPPDEPELWRWTPVGFEFLKFLKPLFQFFAEPLSIITNSLRLIWTSVEAVPGNISSALEDWVSPALANLSKGLKDICDDIVALPDQIGKVISGIKIEVPEITVPDVKVDVPEITVPDVKVDIPDVNVKLPDLPDYTGLLGKIIALLESFFVIDTDKISDRTIDLKKLIKSRFSFLDIIVGIILDNFDFKDAYDYPVIKMQTPDILSNFYTSDYIILVDFKDYAKVIYWARNLVRAMLWFTFGLSVVKHFRTSLHVG